MPSLNDVLIDIEYTTETSNSVTQTDSSFGVFRSKKRSLYPQQSLKIAWTVLNVSEIQTIRGIVDSHIAGTPVAFTPPNGSKGAYRITHYAETVDGPQTIGAEMGLLFLAGVKPPN